MAFLPACLLVSLLAVSCGCSPSSLCPRVEDIFPCRCAVLQPCRTPVPEARCSGIREKRKLKQALVGFANNGSVHLKIDFSHVTLCRDFFPQGLSVKLFRIRNCLVTWNPDTDPLEPLADSLEQVTIVKTNVPQNWSIFSKLRRLRTLEVSECEGMEGFGYTFAGVPATLRALKVTWCKLRDLAAGAFQNLTALQALHLEGTRLEKLRKEVLPDSTPALEYLHLQNNRISEIEEGFFDGMPNLLSVDLSGNSIRAIHRDAFRNSLRVSVILTGNPYGCECSAKWLILRVDDWQLPTCSAPEQVRGKRMTQLQDYFLKC